MASSHEKPDSADSAANPLWGGHYAQGPEEAFALINPSIAFDYRLYAEDIAGSLAHSHMLHKTGILTDAETKMITRGLKQIKDEIERGEFEFKIELEDIHMNIESRLAELIGEAAGKLHTARSRNDQVATDFRLYVRTALDHLDQEIKALQQALLTQAEAHAATIMPGFTHLQAAQPVTFGHHLLAYCEMFLRDRARLEDARTRVNQSPLGAAALAGTSFPINRELTAEALGFNGVLRNSLDAVSDRDFVLEPLAAFAICALHLSRLAEELVIWTSAPFRFVKLPEGFTSGSSIMPQKRNPDAAELIRGKTGRIAAQFQSLAMVMKGLPLAYNKDTQEDKEPFFESSDQLRLCLQAMTGMIAALHVNADTMLAAAEAGYSTATDLADYLVQQHQMPFRKAHHMVGRIVAKAEERGCNLAELELSELQHVMPQLTDDVYRVLNAESSVARRTSFGGTAPVRVREAITVMKGLIA